MNWTAILSQSPTVFVVLTAIFSLCAWLSGQAMANGWRSVWTAVFYAVLIALAHRFLLFALRGASLLDPAGFALSVVYFCAIAWLAYSKRRADRMVSQYPWLYRRDGLLGWRELRD
jgi:hypothetical protein